MLTHGLPPVAYVMFLDVFVLSQRLMVVVSLMETVATWYITEYISSHVGLSLDRLSRWFVPIDYVVLNAILFTVVRDFSDDISAYEATLTIIEVYAWVNLSFVVLVCTFWCLFKYWWLYRMMMTDPVKLHIQRVRNPLDSNEKSLLFWTLDQNGDGIVGIGFLGFSWMEGSTLFLRTMNIGT